MYNLVLHPRWPPFLKNENSSNDQTFSMLNKKWVKILPG
jgi:hypothetical protein